MSETGQHRTQVEPDSLAHGSTVVAAFQSGRFFDGGAANIGVSTSSDAGRTWTSSFLPGLSIFGSPPGVHPRVSDPVVAYDDVRRRWLVGTLGVSPGLTELLVSHSARRAGVGASGRRGARRAGPARLRQGVARLRLVAGEPVPRPLLPRLHRRRARRARGADEPRRRHDLGRGGDRGRRRLRDARRAAGRDARDGLPGRPRDRHDRRIRLPRRRRHVRPARARSPSCGTRGSAGSGRRRCRRPRSPPTAVWSSSGTTRRSVRARTSCSRPRSTASRGQHPPVSRSCPRAAPWRRSFREWASIRRAPAPRRASPSSPTATRRRSESTPGSCGATARAHAGPPRSG